VRANRRDASHPGHPVEEAVVARPLDRKTARKRNTRRRVLSRAWRLATWPLAVLLSLLVVVPLAWRSGYVTRNDLLNVFIGNGLTRYGRLAMFVVVWAFIMALLVTLFASVNRVQNRRDRSP
jgi:hypothetical protein